MKSKLEMAVNPNHEFQCCQFPWVVYTVNWDQDLNFSMG